MLYKQRIKTKLKDEEKYGYIIFSTLTQIWDSHVLLASCLPKACGHLAGNILPYLVNIGIYICNICYRNDYDTGWVKHVLTKAFINLLGGADSDRKVSINF